MCKMVSGWAKIVEKVNEQTDHGGSLDMGQQGEDCILPCQFLMRIAPALLRFPALWESWIPLENCMKSIYSLPRNINMHKNDS